MYQAILFDLDGTLLPMDNDRFTAEYISLLAQTVSKYGYDPKDLVNALWKGVERMVRNDGTRTNYDAFWFGFSEKLGGRGKVFHDIALFNRFYENEFSDAQAFTRENPLARQAVELARQKAGKVILATTPQFPRCAIVERLHWIGLGEEDFDDITDYESMTTCKPNPAYYREVLARNGLKNAECLMIGNDLGEDILPAMRAGLDAYWVKDCPIIREGLSDQGVRGGSFSDMTNYLKALS